MVCMTDIQCKSSTYDENIGSCKLNSDILSTFTTCSDNVRYAQTYQCHESGFFKLCSQNLYTGTYEITGHAFVYISGIWGTVCDDYWEQENHGTNNAVVLCKSLGYSTGSTVYPLQFENDITNSILLDDVMCTGTESTLLQCPHISGNENNCLQDENVRVKCVM
ncbi:hypothetical protein ACF0H5_017691 [Mactra antiquata]